MSDKIERLRKKHEAALAKAKETEKQLKAAKKRIDNQRKTEDRKKDTRRKILLGSFLQNQFAKNPAIKAQLEKDFFASLTRDNDRMLFDLPIVEKVDKPAAVETVKTVETEPA